MRIPGNKPPKKANQRTVSFRLNSRNSTIFESIKSKFFADKKDGEIVQQVIQDPYFWSKIAVNDFDEAIALKRIKQKIVVDYPLDRGEWLTLARLAHCAYSLTKRNQLSCRLYSDHQRATLALAQRLTMGDDEGYFKGNLSFNARKLSLSDALKAEIAFAEKEYFIDPGRAEMAARNLLAMLRDHDKIANNELDHSLRPYINSLFILAARGYSYTYKSSYCVSKTEPYGLNFESLEFNEGGVSLRCNIHGNQLSGMISVADEEHVSVEIGFSEPDIGDLKYIVFANGGHPSVAKGDIYSWSEFHPSNQWVLIEEGKSGIRIGLKPSIIQDLQAVLQQLYDYKTAIPVLAEIHEQWGDV